MTFGNVADSLSLPGMPERSRRRVPGILNFAQEHHLVQVGENIQLTQLICNCCGCCCRGLGGCPKIRISRSHCYNQLSAVVSNECNGCGKCVRICPVEAMSLVSTNDPTAPLPCAQKWTRGCALDVAYAQVFAPKIHSYEPQSETGDHPGGLFPPCGHDGHRAGTTSKPILTSRCWQATGCNGVHFRRAC